MPSAAVGALGSIAGGLISGKGQKDAAKTAAGATDRASQAIIKETRAARTEILDRMIPALKDFGNEMDNLQQFVADGTVDVMKTLTDTTTNAMQILQQSGSNARKAILGSAASAQGMPRQQFEQTYAQVQSLPPAQQDQVLNEAIPGAASFTAGQISPDTGDRSTGVQTPAPAPVPTTTPATAGGAPAPQTPAQRLQSIMDRAMGRGVYGTSNVGTNAQRIGDTNRFRVPIDRPPQGSLAMTATTGADGRPVYAYEGYQDRGTPGISADVSQLGTGIYGDTGPAAPGTGFYGAVDQIDRGEARSLAALASGVGQAREDIRFATDAAVDRLNPYATAGRAALDQEAALSGALGPEAQQAALDSFIESPGQRYLRERQEKALLRNTAAIGGLGGGRVRQQLMEQAMGIAATQQQTHMENLRSLAMRGQTADTTAAGMIQDSGAQLAQLADALGVRGANLITMNAQQKAQLANQAGLSLAQLDQVIGAAQAGQLATLGGQLATTQAGGLADIANMGQQSATTQLSGQQNIAQILANLATQQGTQVANLTTQGGSQLAAGQAGSAATMGQMFKDLGDLGAYTLANRSAATNMVTSGAPAGNPSTDLITNTGMSR